MILLKTQNSCQERGCIWDASSGPNGLPKCYLDIKKVGYSRVSDKQTTNGLEIDLQLKSTAKSTFKHSGQIESLKLEVTYLTERILRFKFTDSKNSRYEVPIQKNFPLLQKPVAKTSEDQRVYTFDINSNKDDFTFSVSRKSSKTKMWVK